MSKQPYIGLRSFGRNESNIFFGREKHTYELLSRLDSNHFLAVVGASGCGKSSLVKAGLIAGLEAGYLGKNAGTHWLIVEVRPGRQPFQTLAKHLYSELKNFLSPNSNPETLEWTLRQSPLSLHEVLSQHPLPNNSKLLIVCDQFEEFFRFFKENQTAEARNFVSLLLASSKAYPLSTTQQSNSIYVVITMRSDFIGDCARFDGLAEAINQGLYLTPRLNEQELRIAIEKPASMFNAEIDSALVMQLLDDAENNQDQLPLLQYVLMRLWHLAVDEDRKPIYITQNDYDILQNCTDKEYSDFKDKKIKGLGKVLSIHADKIFYSLDLKQKQLAEILFRSLCEAITDKLDTRRPTKYKEIFELVKR